MIVIIGASASGKTEVSKILSKEFGIKKCITTTTRKMRNGELNGRDYHFLTKDAFRSLMEKDAFIEVAQYQGNYYGLNKKDVNKNALVIMEPNGANELINKLNDNLFVVFIESPKEKRQSRMLSRGDEIKSIQERLLSDDEIFNKENINKINLHLINNDEPLYQIAKTINESYQSYLLKKGK